MRLRKSPQICPLTRDFAEFCKNDIVLPGEKLRKYFPRSYSPEKIQETIFKLLDAWMRKRQHDKSR